MLTKKTTSVPTTAIPTLTGRWGIIRFLHSGGFGETYTVKDKDTKNTEVAKLERCDTSHPTLLFEYLLYKRFQDGPGIPRLIGYCEDGDFRVLVIERLGNDLWHLVVGKQRRLTLTQVAYIGLEVLNSIEFIHQCGFVHRDIKPGNIMLGLGDNASNVYLIDFGLAKKVISASTSRLLIEDRYVKYRCGTTTRYASIRCLLGREQSFRDDIESLAYSLLELYLGKLPWGDYPRNDVFHSKQIFVTIIQNERIAQKKNIPKPFVKWFDYATHLTFAEVPSYDFLKELLVDCIALDKDNVSLTTNKTLSTTKKAELLNESIEIAKEQLSKLEQSSESADGE